MGDGVILWILCWALKWVAKLLYLIDGA